jgi:outer membrane lipoprotein carrier protein
MPERCLSDNPDMKKILCFFLAGILCGTALPALADGLAQLKQFVAATASAEGAFSQTVMTPSGRKPQQSSGTFALQRPGKFRWSYDKPYPQLLISDGVRVWSFDPELRQVAIKKAGAALGASPAALLAGENLERHFELKAIGTVDGVAYVEATPKSSESNFERVKIGLIDAKPVSMEIHDSFGQISLLRFTRFTVNPPLAASLFHFSPPPGVDVVEE